MQIKKIAIALGISLSFGLFACDDSSSSASISEEENISSETQDSSESNAKEDVAKSSSSKGKSSSSANKAKEVDEEAQGDSESAKSAESNAKEDIVKSSSSKKKSSSSKAKSSSSANKAKDTDEENHGESAASSSSRADDTNDTSTADDEKSDAGSSSSVEIDPEAFNDADLEQCSGKSNGTKVNIGGIPFICMNGQMTPDEDGINELIGNKYKGCEDSKLEDDIWIFYSSPMGSKNTEKIKWTTETSYDYATFPGTPDEMEAFEDLGLGPDTQTIEGANREEVYAKYCGK